jgi:predicted nucleic acid-binding Zn ribbon protein
VSSTDPSETQVGDPAEPAAEGAVEAGVEDRPADGLELARALTRATANASPMARARPRRRRQWTPTQSSGAHPDDRDPQLLDMTLGRLVADHGWQVDLKVHGLLGRWAELVGAEIGDHSTPESFADGVVVVRTDSTAWATQLTLLAPSVVRRLNEELGSGTVLQIDVRGPVGPTWKKGPRSVRGGRGPRDTYG